MYICTISSGKLHIFMRIINFSDKHKILGTQYITPNIGTHPATCSTNVFAVNFMISIKLFILCFFLNTLRVKNAFGKFDQPDSHPPLQENLTQNRKSKIICCVMHIIYTHCYLYLVLQKFYKDGIGQDVFNGGWSNCRHGGRTYYHYAII